MDIVDKILRVINDAKIQGCEEMTKLHLPHQDYSELRQYADERTPSWEQSPWIRSMDFAGLSIITTDSDFIWVS